MSKFLSKNYYFLSFNYSYDYFRFLFLLIALSFFYTQFFYRTLKRMHELPCYRVIQWRHHNVLNNNIYMSYLIIKIIHVQIFINTYINTYHLKEIDYESKIVQ